MGKRYFTVASANALIPRMEEIVSRALQLHSQLRATQDHLVRLGDPATPDLLEPEARIGGDPEARQLKARFRALYESIGSEVSAIEHLGGHVKDIEVGLVDFFSLLGGRDEVLLCWRMGEKRIGFFHDLVAGFGGRKPIAGREFVGEERRLH